MYIFLTIAGYDYKITTSTLIFEPSFEVKSQQQCLEIEIIDDSLPEEGEVLTLLLSTNNSAIKLTTHIVDVYIKANYGKCNLCNDSEVFINVSTCWFIVRVQLQMSNVVSQLTVGRDYDTPCTIHQSDLQTHPVVMAV